MNCKQSDLDKVVNMQVVEATLQRQEDVSTPTRMVKTRMILSLIAQSKITIFISVPNMVTTPISLKGLSIICRCSKLMKHRFHFRIFVPSNIAAEFDLLDTFD